MTTDDQQPNSKGESATMPILAHLSELRVRLIRMTIVLVVCILASYGFRKEILDFIRQPVEEPLKKYTAVHKKKEVKKPVIFDRDSFHCQCLEKSEKKVEQQAEIQPENAVMTEKQDASADSSEKIVDASTDKVNPEKVAEKAETLKKGPDIPEVDLNQPLIKQNIETAVLTPAVLDLDCTCTQILAKPLEPPPAENLKGSSMVFLNLPEVFFSQMKVAIFAGFFLAFPYLIIELWGFIAPALYLDEKKIFWVFAIFTYLCFIGGALFGYFIVFPFGFDFFLSLTQIGEIMPSLSIGEYLAFALKLLIAFGIVFEMPLMVFVLARMGVVTPEWMVKNAKFAVLVIFIAAAMLTPPDPLTMLLMAGPLLILYIVSIVVAFLAVNRKKAALRSQGFDDDDLDIEDEDE